MEKMIWTSLWFHVILLAFCGCSGLTDAAPHQEGERAHRSYDHNGHCVQNEIEGCRKLFGNYTIFPNLLNHQSAADAQPEFNQYIPLIEVECSPALEVFLCAVYTPVCTVLAEAIPPCRHICEQARSGCEPLMNQFGFYWPDKLSCEKFPEGGLCVAPDVPAHTTPGYTSTTWRPDVPAHTTPGYTSTTWRPSTVRPTTPPPSVSEPYVAFSVKSNDVEQARNDAIISITTIDTNFNTESFGGMERNQMLFVAPLNGIYVFMATSMSTTDDGCAPLVLRHNDRDVMVTSYLDISDMGAAPLGTNQIILTLNIGDRVELKVKGGGFFVSTFQEASVVTFTGYLLKTLI